MNKVSSTSLISAEPPNSAFRKVMESRLSDLWKLRHMKPSYLLKVTQPVKAGFKLRSACLQFSAPISFSLQSDREKQIHQTQKERKSA